MLNRNEVWVGLVIGLVLPFVGYAVLLMISEYLVEERMIRAGFRPRTLALIAVCLNLLPMSRFRSRRWEQSLRGLLLVTMGLAVAWFFYFKDGFF